MNVIDFCESILLKGLEDKFLSPDVVRDYEYKTSSVPFLPTRDKSLLISGFQRQKFPKIGNFQNENVRGHASLLCQS